MTAATMPAPLLIAKPYPSEGSRSPEETVYGHLEHVLSSGHFRRAPGLHALLRYVVETTLDGRAGELKEYTLGAEGLGRGDGFDPRIDPIVRVQMRKVRIRLERYYADERPGKGIRFEIPKGRYVPKFVGLADSAAVGRPRSSGLGPGSQLAVRASRPAERPAAG